MSQLEKIRSKAEEKLSEEQENILNEVIHEWTDFCNNEFRNLVDARVEEILEARSEFNVVS